MPRTKKKAAPAAEYIKISSAGAELPDDAKEWDAVKHGPTGLMFPAELSPAEAPWKQTCARSTMLKLAGFGDWRAATRKEAMLIIDDTRFAPAVHPFFRYPKSGWIWTATLDASAPGSCAWGVGLYDGGSYICGQGGGGLALAVRGPVAFPGQ